MFGGSSFKLPFPLAVGFSGWPRLSAEAAASAPGIYALHGSRQVLPRGCETLPACPLLGFPAGLYGFCGDHLVPVSRSQLL